MYEIRPRHTKIWMPSPKMKTKDLPTSYRIWICKIRPRHSKIGKPSFKMKNNHPKPCKRSDIRSPSKTYQDLYVFLMLPQGEISKFNKTRDNTPNMDAKYHLLGQRPQKTRPSSFQDLQT